MLLCCVWYRHKVLPVLIRMREWSSAAMRREVLSSGMCGVEIVYAAMLCAVLT